MGDELSKYDSLAVPPATAPGYDFLSLPSINQSSSPESSGSGSSSEIVESPTTIDPQLVGTPAPSKAASEFDDEEEEGDEDDDFNDQMDLQSIPEDSVVAPVKVGGKGKSNRKGTVREGGIVKRSSSAEKKENTKPSGMISTTSMEADDWRPTPEEYKKMSSKEKRQLRNKISARNFRVRRKEYITTLEGDIAERDRLIDAIRNELGSTKHENVALRQEIAQLKKALLDGRGRADTPVLPPPAPLPAVPASVLAASASTSSSPPPTLPRSPLLTPNMQKDLPTSPRMGSRAFWGGASSIGGYGSFTPVHTTLVPDLSSVLSGKPVAGRKSPTLQENINPTLNGSAASLAHLLSGRNEEKPKEQQQLPMGAFDAFSDINPFTLKSLDAYRMHLWGKMAQQQVPQRQGQAQQQPTQSPSGLAGNLRPHYFAKSPSLNALLSGKAATSSVSHINPYPSPPNSPPLGPRDAPTAQHAMLANIASQTLFSKLGSAFWDAFARPSGTIGANGHAKREWDAEKVRRVMEGTAVVQIVDVEPQPAARAPSPRPTPVQERQEKPRCHASVSDLLAESMATLNLGRK
ncbi:uncharacterized protein TRAVEDRAFT_137124 [Trametes versicolor FP-101664 SS1]|uniref:BZIP domain-containing protein n=1 Tax=Trametes versicolor (strain FP-101664) TaxID=717944 RepID=R7S6N4_TRAVS|nr:uncharacterized protein TRAVEDRAFT_137124 [Trametes versicolor FP-101664 SS1]EIW51613.1 hypothetical protein TRAVEDRAFT_137124 [Trametes versicolor FP-101664 SS1]